MNKRDQATHLPFSLIAGNGIGDIRQLSSPALLGRLMGQAKLQYSVNAASGNLIAHDRLLCIPCLGGEVNFQFVYNSQQAWRFQTGKKIQSLSSDETLIQVEERDGHITSYQRQDDGRYYSTEPTDGAPVLIVENDKSYTGYHPLTRITEKFDADGNLTRRIDASGNETIYSYDLKGELQFIDLPGKTRLEIKRSAQHIELLLNNQLIQGYVLDTDGKLITSSTPDGYDVNYQYKNNKLDSIQQTDGTALEFTFQDDGKLKTLQLGSSQEAANNIYKLNYQDNISTLTDASGAVTTATLDNNQIVAISDKPDETKKYEYYPSGQLKKITYPDETSETFEYDPKTGLLTKHTRRDQSIAEYQYSADAIPVLLAKTTSDTTTVAKTRYIYETINQNHRILRFEISAEGRVTEYLRNKDNGLLEGKRQFYSDRYPTTAGAELSDLVTWSASLLAASTLTQYIHDDQGRLSKTCQYLAIDENGKGIDHEDNPEETLGYDDLSRINYKKTKRQKDKFIEFSFELTATGHLKTSTRGVGAQSAQTTSYEYKNNSIITTHPNGNIQTQTRDTQGSLVSSKAEAKNETTRESRYQHYPANNVSIAIAADKGKTITLHDDQKRPLFIISQQGAVTEIEYNAKYRYQKKSQYAQPIDTSTLSDKPTQAEINAQIAITENKDRETYLFFDKNNKTQFEIDAENFVTEYKYDCFGNRTQTIHYADPVTDQELANLLIGKALTRTGDRNKDRITTQFYDKDGKKIGEQDTAGYVTQLKRDAAGRIQEAIHYATPTVSTSTQWADCLPSTNPDNNAHHLYFYNLLNQCIAEVDAEGYLTTHAYDSDGKQKQSIRFEREVPTEWYQDPSQPPKVLSSDNDQTTNYTYDDLGRLSQTTQSNRKQTTYTYDSMDHGIGFTSSSGDPTNVIDGDSYRATFMEYNAFGNKTKEISPLVAAKLKKLEKGDLLADAKKQALAHVLSTESTRNEYNEMGYKTKSTDPLDHSTLYYYNQDGHLEITIDPTGAVIQNTEINAFGEVLNERRYYNRISKEQLATLTGDYATDAIKALIIKNDAKDINTQYQRNRRGEVTQKTDGEQNISQFEYNAFRQCKKELLPVNSKNPTLQIDHEYDARGNEKTTRQTSQNQSITMSRKFEHFSNKQTESTNELGGRTKQTLDKLGRIKTIQQEIEKDQFLTKAEMTYDAFSRVKIKIDANQQVATTNYDQKTRTQTTTLGNETTSQRQNVFGQLIETNNAGKNKTVFTHAADGQIIGEQNEAGSRAVTLTLTGKKDSETDFNQIPTQYSYNEADQLTTTIADNRESGLKRKTTYTPNAFGQQETITDSNGVVKQNEFDRCGNPTKTIRDAGGLNLTQVNQYNARGSQTDTIQGDDKATLHKKVQLDDFNRVTVSITDPNKLAIKTTTLRNAAGNIIKETDPNGNPKRTYYNLLQQKRFEVKLVDSLNASATEYDYTPSGKIKSIRLSAATVAKNTVTDETTLSQIKDAFASTKQDSLTLYFYNESDRERFKLAIICDPLTQQLTASVQERLYDAAGRETAQIVYAGVLDASNYADFTTESLVNWVQSNKTPNEDRLVLRWSDGISRERFTLDQNGRLTETQYDAAGHAIATIQYHDPVDLEAWKNKSIDDFVAAFKPSADKGDKITYRVYDALGRTLFKVMPDGGVTQYEYDIKLDDKLSLYQRSCQYKYPLKPSADYQQLLADLSKLTPASTDKITLTEYDKGYRVTSITDALKNKDIYRRNALDNTEIHTDRAGKDWGYQYDTANRLTDEISPTTTIAIVKKTDDGKLTHELKQTTITKHTDYDLSGNATRITEGKGSGEERAFIAAYTPQNNIASTQVPNVTVNDPSKPASLTTLPDKPVTLETAKLYDTQGNVIAEKNEAGFWCYHVYDNKGRQIFDIDYEQAVTRYSYNSFGEPIKELRYAKKLTGDFSQYIEPNNLLTRLQAIEPDANNDRIKETHYNASGKIDNIKTGKVFYYSDGNYGTGQPETKIDYSPSWDCMRQAVIQSRNPDVWREKLTWYDACGRILAEVDEEKYLKRYYRNALGAVEKRIEYATALTWQLTINTSLFELDTNTIVSSQGKDRTYVYEYDALGQQRKEILKKHVAQKLQLDSVTKVPTLVDLPEADLVKETTYTKTQQIDTTINEDKTTEQKIYDERQLVIAERQTTRTADVNGEMKLVTPVTHYAQNAFGKAVVTEKASEITENNETREVNRFVFNRSLQNNAGLVVLSQDANGSISGFTYTPTRKVDRQIEEITSFAEPATEKHTQEATGAFVNLSKDEIDDLPELLDDSHLESKSTEPTVKHIDETQIVYDKCDRPTYVAVLRDNKLEEETYTKFNAFGDFSGEGKDNATWPLYKQRNASGNPWLSTSENGAPTLLLQDLLGHETIKIQSFDEATDLSKLNYDATSFQKILDSDSPKLARTETAYNGVGLPSYKKSPLWFRLGYSIPTRSYQYDAWHNPTKEKNSFGKPTDSEYNHRNKLTKRILPETDAWDEHGISTRTRPTTIYGYNERSIKIGVTDPNKSTKGWVLDEAGQWVQKYLGDGTRDQARTFSVDGFMTSATNAANKRTTYEHDLLGNTLAVNTPDPSKFYKYQVDERGNRISEEDALSHKTQYIYDARKNVTHLILPGGQCTKTKHDRNHQPLEVINPDKSVLSWERDYFGKAEKHRDLSGKEHTYTYISGQMNSQSSQDLRERQCYAFDGTIQYLDHLNKDYDHAHQFPIPISTSPQLVPVSPQEIKYDYEYGLLKKLTDTGTGKYEEYETDLESRNSRIKIYRLADSTLLRQIETQYDEIGRESVTTNKQTSINAYVDEIVCRSKYDPASNRRALGYKITPTSLSTLCPPSVVEDEKWYTYDTANRVVINGGKLENGNIVIGTGGQFSYQNHLRTGERYWWDNRYIDATLSYTDDGNLNQTQCNGYALSTSREYNSDDTIKVFDVRREGHTDSRQSTFSTNGLISHETLLKDGSVYSDTSNTLDESRGIVTAQDSNYPTLQAKSHIDYGYIAGDSWLLSSASGTYTNPYGTNTPKPAQFLYDANFCVQSKMCSSDESDLLQTFTSTSDGTILDKRSIVNLDTIRLWQNEFVYLYNADKDILGAYQKTYPTHIPGSSGGSYDSETSLQLAHYLGHKHGDTHIFDTTITPLVSYLQLPVLAFPKQDADLNSALNGIHNQPFPQSATIQTYVVKPGDTFKQISKNLTGGTQRAGLIARSNGYDTSQHAPKAGTVLRIPQSIPMYNQAEVAHPYQTFVNLILGSLSPKFVAPQPPPPPIILNDDDDDGFFGDLVKIIAVSIVCAVAPELAGVAFAAAFGVAATTAQLAVTTGVMAAIGDAAVQGVAVAVGIQKRFSATEMLEVGVSAGVGQTFAAGTSPSALAENALKIGTASVTTQLLEMAAGLRTKFSAPEVAEQIAATVVDAKANSAMADKFGQQEATLFAESTVDSTANALLGRAITRAPLSVSAIASSAIGSYAGSRLGTKLSDQLNQWQQSSATTQDNTPATASAKPVTRETNKEMQRAEVTAQLGTSDLSGMFDTSIDPNDPKWREALSDMASQQRQAKQSYSKAQKHYYLLDEGRQETYRAMLFDKSSKAKVVGNTIDPAISSDFLDGLSNSIKEAYLSPADWSAASLDRVKAIAIEMHTHVSGEAAALQSSANHILSSPVLDDMATEVGYHPEKVLAAEASEMSSYAKMLKSLSHIGKVPLVFDGIEGVKKTYDAYKADNGTTSRTAITQTAKVVGGVVTGDVATLAMGFLVPETLGVSLVAAPAVTVGASAAGGYALEQFAGTAYDDTADFYKYIKSKF